MSSRKRTSRKKIPESLRINAIANENGITEWKRHGKIKHQANELHELTNRIRKNTSRAIEKYMKLNINTIGELILATDDTCKGRGFTSLHILMRNLGTLTKEIETKEQITRDNYITWHLKCLDKYLTTIKKIHPNLIEQIIKIKNHDGRTPLFILFQQPLLTNKHVELCKTLCPSGFYEFCTFRYSPINALVRNSSMTFNMIQMYVDLICKKYGFDNNNNDNILFTVDRTKRRRTPLHELVLSKYCTKDILLYYIDNSYKNKMNGWNHFMYQRDGHGHTAFELAMQNENFMTDKVLKSFLLNHYHNNNKKNNNAKKMKQMKNNEKRQIYLSRTALNNLCKNSKCTPQMLRTAFSFNNPGGKHYKSVKVLASIPDESCDTLLHVLCGAKNVKKEHFIVYFEFLNKTDLNTRDRNGDSPLHIYCANNTTLNEGALHVLLDNVEKETFNRTDKYGENIVHILMQNPKINSKIIKLIGNHKKSKQLLLMTNKKHFERNGLHELCLNPAVTSRMLLEYMKHAPKAAKIRDSIQKSPLSLLCSENKNVNEKMVLLFLQNKEIILDEMKQRDVDGHHSLYGLLRVNTYVPYKNIQAIVMQFTKYILPYNIKTKTSTVRSSSSSGKTSNSSNKTNTDYFYNVVNTLDNEFLWRRDTALTTVCKRAPRIHLEDFKFHHKKGVESFSAIQANGRSCLHDLLGNNIALTTDVLNTFCKFAKKTKIGELINAIDNYNENPLFIFVRNQKKCIPIMMETLFKHCKIDKIMQAMEACNLYHEMPLHILCKQKFISNGILNTYLTFASKSSKQCLYALDDQGCTPLHILCKNYNADSSCLEIYLHYIRTKQYRQFSNNNNYNNNNNSNNNNNNNTDAIIEKNDFNHNKNILIRKNKRNMTPLMCLVRREKPPTSKEISIYFDNGNDETGMKALNMICGNDNATTPLKHLSRRVEEERIAKGVLNTCLELWSSCSTFVTADDTNNYNVDELRKQFKGYNNNNNNNNNTTNINSYYENTATTSTTNTTNEEKCDDDDVNRTIKSTPPLLYTLNKSDETSRPAHDEVLNIVKRVKKNPYLVINSEKETVPESDGTKNTIDKIEAEEENVLTYEEQKELIKKLQHRIIEQQKIIKKLSNNRNNLK